MSNSSSKVIVALDFPSSDQALNFARQRLNPDSCRVKVGKELFTSTGPAIVSELVGLGYDVFLDLKFHDIPNTVGRAVSAAARLGVWMVNVHASGGSAMMQAAREALSQVANPPLLIAVTVLTSMSDSDLAEIGMQGRAEEAVVRLAKLAEQSGMDGVVCSPAEAVRLREVCGKRFLLVTPGVRPAGSDRGDQHRVTTPGDAIANGSDYLVVGRPVTQADDPMSVLLTINSEIRNFCV